MLLNISASDDILRKFHRIIVIKFDLSKQIWSSGSTKYIFWSELKILRPVLQLFPSSSLPTYNLHVRAPPRPHCNKYLSTKISITRLSLSREFAQERQRLFRKHTYLQNPEYKIARGGETQHHTSGELNLSWRYDEEV